MTDQPTTPARQRSRPVQWHELLTEMEAFQAAHGWALTDVWTLVHRGDYPGALRAFKSVRDSFGTRRVDR